ncbi:MAG: hypothetical protein HYZ68_07060 [Chloroflexi bacterium]|nr:hypothetical protein [Chloroflexota bacterium]
MTSAGDKFTVDELMVTCIARQAVDGEVMAQGIATPLVVAGYILAKLTHAPRLIFAVAVGGVLTEAWSPLSLTGLEEANLRRPRHRFSFDEATGILLPSFHPKEFFRPAQVDRRGNFNNVVIGPYHRPRLRLPGCGGIADVSVYSPNIYLYLPRHSRAAFVARVDFVSGLGTDRGPGPRYLLSDLGVFDFQGGNMRLVSYHPGVSVEEIQRRTGFPLELTPDLHQTAPPSREEVRLLREVIDPLGIRQLETLTGAKRRAKLREILALEKARWPRQPAEVAARIKNAPS